MDKLSADYGQAAVCAAGEGREGGTVREMVGV